MLRRNMTSAECQISDPKGRYLVFTLLFFQMPMMKTQGLNTKIITKKPKSARNCESRVSVPAAWGKCIERETRDWSARKPANTNSFGSKFHYLATGMFWAFAP